MNYPLLFPTTYIEDRYTTSRSSQIVFVADTNKKNLADVFRGMNSFLAEETRFIAKHREEARNKYPKLFSK